MTHTLRIAHKGTHNVSAIPDTSGNYLVAVVRKGLSDTEVVPANIRTSPGGITGVIQVSPDGGTTWISDPNSDPRYGATKRLPPRPASGTRQCDAAANMTAKFHSFMDEIIAAVNLAQAVNAVIGTLLEFMPEVGLIGDVIVGVASALLTIGQVTLNADFTPAVYDRVEGILYCNISADGTVTAAQLAAIEAAIASQLGGVVSTAFNYTMTGLGEVGLSNAGATGSLVGNCTAYGGGVHTFNLRTSVAPVLSIARGTFVSGQGVLSAADHSTPQQNVLAGVTVNVPVGATLTDVKFYWNVTVTGSTPEQKIFVTPGSLLETGAVGVGTGNAHHVVAATYTAITCLIIPSQGGSYTGVAYLTQIDVTYACADPF